MNVVTIICAILGFLLVIRLLSWFSIKQANTIDRELEEVLRREEFKVKGRFE